MRPSAVVAALRTMHPKAREVSPDTCAHCAFVEALRGDDIIALPSMRFGSVYNGAELRLDVSAAVDGVIVLAFQGAIRPYPPLRVVSQPPSAGSREDDTM